ncbi:MAG: DUF2333 family protein [Desulfobaccales bacterium]
MSAEKLPLPLPPEPQPSKKMTILRRYRFLLVVLVVLLFFGLLFSKGIFWKARPAVAPAPSETPLAAAPLEQAAPSPPVTSEGAAPAPAPAPPPEPARPEKPPLAAGAEPVPKPEPAPKELPSLAPAPPPLPKVAPVAKVKGAIFTQALIKIMDDQVNKTLFGWRPNTIIFGKMGLTDNVNNLQLGVLEVARRTVIVLNENMTRFAVTESHNPQVNEAMNFLMVSPDKYWFPSASGKYREAMQDLAIYIEQLSQGQSRFYPRVDNLITLFNHYRDILGSSYYNLVKDTEADGSAVSWFKADDYFYFSKGVAIALAEMLEAVKEDFHQELQKKNTQKLLDDAIHALQEASHLKPWLITNGNKDGILANHRANLSTYIGEAEHVVSTLQTVLATN